MEFDFSKPIAGPCSGEVQVCSLENSERIYYVHADSLQRHASLVQTTLMNAFSLQTD